MSNRLISTSAWQRITATAKRSPRNACVAVAYLGSGASRLLPIKKGGRLVVDMGLAALRTGETNPAELIKLINNGVSVYSQGNLHAKVFAFKGRAFIGSANVSQNSARSLIEAVVETSDPRLIAAARQFVLEQCLRPVTAEYARQMQKHYRPLKFEGGPRQTKHLGPGGAPPLRVVQLQLVDYSEREDEINEVGMERAEKKRKHPRSSVVDFFRWAGKCPFNRHDLVLQVTTEGRGRVFVSPPGNVIDVKRYRVGKRDRAFVYVEIAKSSRRRRLSAIMKSLGRTAGQRLKRGGMLGDPEVRRQLLRLWSMEP